MDCRHVEKAIQQHWDRELDADASGRLRRHLGECLSCRAQFGALDDFLRSAPAVAVPAGLRDRILAALPSDLQSHPATEHFKRKPALAAGLAADSPSQAPARYRLAPLAWVGALAACIALLVTPRLHVPGPVAMPEPPQMVSSPAALPSLVLAAMQPGQFGAGAVAAAAQAAALEQVTQAGAQTPLPLLLERRPLRQDYVPAETDREVQQLPAVISAFKTLGA